MESNFGDTTIEDISYIPDPNESYVKPQCTDSESQTTEELQPKKVDAEVSSKDRKDAQTDAVSIKYSMGKANETQLLAFLEKVAPIALKAVTPTQAYQFLEQKTTTNSVELVNTYETDSHYFISSISCNCSGSTVAVGLQGNDHYGFCRHQTQLHLVSLVSSGGTTNHTISMDSCVSSLKFHPNYPNIIGIGHHTGEVSIYRNEEKWAHSELGETHTTPVIAIDWLLDKQTVVALVSASTEGLICVWPLKGRDTRTKVLTQCTKMNTETISSLFVLPGSQIALIGLENGRIKQVELPLSTTGYVNPEQKEYFDHIGPVTSIAICPITPSLFASTGSDESFVIRNTSMTGTIISQQLLQEPLTDIKWSPHSPSVVAVCGQNRVAILDFCVSERPLVVLDAPKANKLCWSSTNHGMIIVGGEDGKIRVFESKTGAFERRPGSARKMVEWESKKDINA